MSNAPKRPVKEVLPVAEELVRVLSPFCERIEIAGSLRRQCPLVSDIELVAIPKVESVERAIPGDLFGAKEVVTINRLWGALDGMLGSHYVKAGEKYRAFICPKETIQVDLFTAEPGNWGLILLIRTGPWEFSKSVVTRLRRERRPSFDGWIRQAPEFGPTNWTEEQLAGFGKLPAATEQRVFEHARLPFIEPKYRNATADERFVGRR